MALNIFWVSVILTTAALSPDNVAWNRQRRISDEGDRAKIKKRRDKNVRQIFHSLSSLFSLLPQLFLAWCFTSPRLSLRRQRRPPVWGQVVTPTPPPFPFRVTQHGVHIVPGGSGRAREPSPTKLISAFPLLATLS